MVAEQYMGKKLVALPTADEAVFVQLPELSKSSRSKW